MRVLTTWISHVELKKTQCIVEFRIIRSMAISNEITKTTQTTKKTGGYELPWVERYRPKTLDEVVGNEETLVRLQALGVDGNMPNLILCGPPGTGKVRCIVCLVC